MPPEADDFSIFEQVRATASRRIRLRLGLPATLRQAIPIELALVAPAWLLICPVAAEPDWLAIGLRSGALAITAAALKFFRKMGSRPLEIGWRLGLFAQLLALLQSVSVAPGLPAGTIPNLASSLTAVGGAGLLWGLRLDRIRRGNDIERLKRAIADRRNAHRRFVDLVDTVDGVVWEATADPFEFHFVGRRAGVILGFAPEIWIQQPDLWSERIHPDDRDHVLGRIAEAGRNAEGYQLEYRMIAADGRTVWARDLVNAVRDGSGQVRLRGVTFDVTETKHLEQRLRHSANHDALTGLPNRVAFGEGLERAFRSPSADSLFAVLFLDLDRFKLINDTLGHLAGDTVLKEAAGRIGRAVRSRDLVARLGGDEFAVLAENLHTHDEAVELAARLRAELNRPVEVDGRMFQLSASVGIKLAKPGAGSPKEMLRDADTAMYCAKETSRGSQQVFEHAMHDRLVADVQVENDIRAALEAERLTVRYDPIADLRDGAIVGFEAALYWETGNGGLLGPSEYTDVARQSGLSGRLGWIALRQTFLSAGSLDEPAPFLIAPTPMPLLRQTDFLEQLDREVRDTAARPNRVVLAIPEEAAGSPDAAGLLAAIRERGFRISLSDFGFGGASLRQLCRLPLDFARIDPADLQRSATAGAESSLLQAMIKLCLDLQIQVIAFGVRGEDERRLLHGMGCTLGQGSLFGAALRPEQLERVLRRAWASSTGERSA